MLMPRINPGLAELTRLWREKTKRVQVAERPAAGGNLPRRTDGSARSTQDGDDPAERHPTFAECLEMALINAHAASGGN